MFEEEVKKLQGILDDSSNMVFFGGAGVSTESNIPDFRSADGLYQQEYRYSPEQIVSHSFFMQNTEGFYEFYKEKMMFLDAKPNPAHLKLAELEEAGKLSAVITQNIDVPTRRRAAGMCWSYMEVSIETIVKSAANSTMGRM